MSLGWSHSTPTAWITESIAQRCSIQRRTMSSVFCRIIYGTLHNAWAGNGLRALPPTPLLAEQNEGKRREEHRDDQDQAHGQRHGRGALEDLPSGNALVVQIGFDHKH